jgi:small subunit ribosomal protein S2
LVRQKETLGTLEKGGSDVELLTIKELLETGVHFGHRVRKWNPKMRDYIFTERKGIHIIDLEKTIRLFEEAYLFVRDTVASGKNALFVGTKRQVQETIAEEAKRCGAHYVNQRWLGGTLTNFGIIQKRIQRMKDLEDMEEAGVFDHMPPKEAQNWRRELMKLQRTLEGLRHMDQLPGVLFVVDTILEKNAIHEAKLLGIPVVAIVDTNCDPDPIDFPIPGNDDAIKATKLITARIADAVLEGREGRSGEKISKEAAPLATATASNGAEGEEGVSE